MSKILARGKIEIFLFILFFIFSFWLMNKSFGYDMDVHAFRLARHQVGDFGLHISLIRSFSWGNNFPVESPFFPGVPLSYHYYFDLFSGLLVRFGLPIVVAFNGLSIIFFTILLWLIYKLPQIIFKEEKIIGVLSVILFIFHSNLTFVDFFKDKSFNFSTLQTLWYLPDYIHKGPFDGSIISLFFTLNVFLNQRHLIAALAISLVVLYFLLQRLTISNKISIRWVILIGIIVGFNSRFHTLIFLSNLIIISLLFIYFKRLKLIWPFVLSALLLFIPHLRDILQQESHQIINLGFLSDKPLSIGGFLYFWLMNLGISIFLIPFGFFLSNSKQKLIFLSFLPLFVLGNIFQFSFKIEHNHSLFNYFIILSNFYIAFVLVKIWQQKKLAKMFAVIFFFLLTISGFIDLLVAKNDYQFMLKDAPSNTFVQWINKNAGKNDVFLARKEILDPITFSGRRNYLGFVFDMGNDIMPREKIVKTIFETQNNKALNIARKEGIQYIVLPNSNIVDFNYNVDRAFFQKTLPVVYEDDQVMVFKL